MNSFQRSATVYLAGAAANAAIPFFLLPLLTRLLGPAGFGNVGVYLALVNIAAVLVGLSTHGLISVVHFRDGPERVPWTVGACLRVLATTATFLLIAVLLFRGQIARSFGIPSSLAWTIVVAAAGQFLVNIALAVFQVREQAWRVAGLQVGLSLSWAAVSVILIGGLGWGWEGRAIGQVAGVGLAAAVAMLWLSRAECIKWRGSDGAPMRAALGFGVLLVPHGLATAIISGADRLVLQRMVGADAVGHYFAAFQIAALLTVGAAAVNQAWVPWLYRRLASRKPCELVSVVRVSYSLFALWACGAAALWLAAPWVVRVVAGPGFEPAVALLRWLSPAAALSGLYYFLTNYLFFARRTGLLSTITVVVSTAQLGLTVVLVDYLGVRGAAIATLVGAAAYFVAIWAASQFAISMPWRLTAPVSK